MDTEFSDTEGWLYYAILHKAVDHPQILVFWSGPETSPP